MVSTAVSSAPVTSWWYGQGRAVDVVRRLESLSVLSPSPGPAGVVIARRDELTVTFVEGLKAPLPQPWQPAGREARMRWEAVDPGNPPDPDHPVYLVVFGTTDDGALVGLNLAAFSRIRIQGDPATATALVGRWVLELLATHPGITIGVTDDVWRGPLTTRVQPVAPSRVPDVDVLVCGAALTYAERAQIVAASTSPILLDLGQDAAVSTMWAITCGPDRLGQISRGSSSRPMTATLILPSAEVVERCADLLVDPSCGAAGGSPDPTLAPELIDDTDPQLSALDASGPLFDIPESPPAAADPADDVPASGGAIDFFAPAASHTPAPPAPVHLEERTDSQPVGGEVTRWPATGYEQADAGPCGACRADHTGGSHRSDPRHRRGSAADRHSCAGDRADMEPHPRPGGSAAPAQHSAARAARKAPQRTHGVLAAPPVGQQRRHHPVRLQRGGLGENGDPAGVHAACAAGRRAPWRPEGAGTDA